MTKSQMQGGSLLLFSIVIAVFFIVAAYGVFANDIVILSDAEYSRQAQELVAQNQIRSEMGESCLVKVACPEQSKSN